MATKSAFHLSRPVLAATIAVPVAVYAYNRSFSSSLISPRAKAEAPAQPRKIFNGSLGFVDLRLQSAEQVNHDTKRLRFELPDGNDLSGFDVISAIMLKATTKNSWLPTLRPYSPISSPSTPGHVDFLVKRYETGPMSTHLHSLQPGQTQSFFTMPLSEYAYKPNTHKHAVLIAGGAGITPMYQLLKRIFQDPEDCTSVTLVFGVNTDRHLLFREEFERLQQQFPGRFKCIYTVTNPDVGSANRKGRVTAELLKEVIPGPETAGLKVFVCGPSLMEEAIAGKKRGPLQGSLGGVLRGLGYRKEQVHKL